MAHTQNRDTSTLSFDAALPRFSAWLQQSQKSPLSAKTVKNYVSDIRRFFLWHSQVVGEIPLGNVRPETLSAYFQQLIAAAVPESTLARKLASLRKLEQWVTENSPVPALWNLPSNPGTSTKTELAWEKVLNRFAVALKGHGCKPETIQNYLQDVRLFLDSFPPATLAEICTKPKVAEHLAAERRAGLSSWTLRRRLTSLKRFFSWAHQEEYLPEDPFASRVAAAVKETAERFIPLAFFRPRVKPGPVESLLETDSPLPRQPGLLGLYDWYSRTRFSSYLHLSVLVIFCIMVALFGYRQFFGEVEQRYAYPSEPVRPGRILSFQGRLTDSGGTPITTPINFIFRLYNDESAGTELWDSSDLGACSIDPDQDGVFSVLLGDSVNGCGNEIAENVFSENSEVWLEVQVSSETLTPRQRIATVPYALNTETVQGFPVSLGGEINTIPVINALGEIIIGANNPSLIASSGAFLIRAESFTFETEAGTAGDINFAPDAGGSVNILSATTSQDSLYISNANLTSGNLIRGEVGNNNTTFNLLSLAAGSVLDNKFVVDALGNTTIDGYLQAPGATISATYSGATPLIVNGTGGQILSLNNAGQLSLATQGSSGGLVLGGDATLYRSGADQLTTPDSLVIGSNLTVNSLGTQGGVIYASDNNGLLAVTAAGSNGQCLQSNGTSAPTWGSCSGGGGGGGDGFWTAAGPVLYPLNTALDVAVGGSSTASAKFQVLAASGTATSQGQLTFRGTLDPKINILNGENFGIRTSVGGDAGLSERLTVLNNGNVGIGDATPTSLFTVGSGDLFEVDANGDIVDIGGGGHSLADVSGDLTITSTGELILADTRVTGTRLSVADTALDAGLPQGIIDAINTLYAGGAATDTFWVQANGALQTANNTVDVLFGGTSSEAAKFAFLNVNTGTPTASIAGSLALAAPEGANPTTKLNVYNGGSFGIRTSVGGDAGLSERLTVLNNGRVGIGTTTPSELLHLRGATGNTGSSPITLRLDSSTNSQLWSVGSVFSRIDSFLSADPSGGGINEARTRIASVIEDTTATDIGLAFYTSDGNLVTKLNERMRITSDGNVGLGTTNPLATLHVDGEYSDHAAAIIDQNFSGDILTASAGAQTRLRITNAGNLIFNQSSSVQASTGDLTLDSTSGNLYFNDVRTASIPLTVADTALNPNLTQGIIDAINDIYDLNQGSDTFWAQAAGALYTANNTVDVLFGGNTTESAKFAFLNVDSGTPTASVSAGAAGATYITANGTVATTALQNLVLGNATTGDVVLSPRGGTGTIIAQAPTLRFNQAGTISTTTSTLTLAPTGNIQFFNSSNTLTSGGTLTIAGNLTVNGGTISRTGNLSVTTGGSGDITLNAAGEIIFNDTRTGNIQFSLTDTSLNIFPAADRAIVDALNYLYDKAVPGTGNNSSGFWSRLTGLIYPTNTWESVAVGGSSTASATFHINASNGTASSAGTLAFTGLSLDPKIDVLNGENFGIRTSLNGNAGLSERLTVLNNGNVGIGTTNPGRKLHVDGGITRLTNTNGINLLEFGDTASTYDWAFYQSSNDLNLWDNNASAARLTVQTSTGNFGIGDTTPTSLLTVGSGDAFQVNSSGNVVDIGGGGHSLTDTAGDLSLNSAAALTLTSVGNLTLDSSGELYFNDTRTTAPIPLTIADTALNANLTQGIVDAINDIYGFATDSDAFWVQNAGSLQTANNTVDVLFGGTSSEAAKFAFLNVNDGTPTASISAGLAGAAFLTADGNLATTVMQDFTLGGATTGDIFLSARGGAGSITAQVPNFFFDQAATLTTTTGNFTIDSAGELILADTRVTGTRLSVTDTGLDGGLPQGIIDAINSVYQAQQSGGINFWQQALGALYPINSSLDVLVGGTSTQSAKFAFYNVNSGTPTASIAGSLAGRATYLTGDGLLATTAMQDLFLGNATTGNIILRPRNGAAGRVGILTSNPNAVLHTTGGYSNHALAIFDQLNSGDILTASAGGVTRLRLTNAGNIEFNQASSITTTGVNTLTLAPGGNLQFFNTSNFITSAGDLTIDGTLTIENGHTVSNVSNNLTLTSTSSIVSVADNLHIGAAAGGNIVDLNNQTYIALEHQGTYNPVTNVFPVKKIRVNGLLDVTDYINGQRGATFSAFVPSDKLLTLNGDNQGQTGDYININTFGMTGGNVFRVTANGLTGINLDGATAAGQLHVISNTNVTPTSVFQQRSTAQTADLTQWRGTDGTVLSRVDEFGNFRIGQAAPDIGKLSVSSSNGNALVVLNQNDLNQNILAASASGITRASIDRYGDYTMHGPKSQNTPSAAAKDVFVYDTSADIDGGRWTDSDRALASSWYNETLDATYDSCDPTTNDRCGQKAFPKKASIQATATEVAIYDADTQALWMRFYRPTGNAMLGTTTNNEPNVIAAHNGRVYIGMNSSSATGMYVVDFINDTMARYDTSGSWLSQQQISGRNGTVTFQLQSSKLRLPSNIVNDISPTTISGDTKLTPFDNTYVSTRRYTATNPANSLLATYDIPDYSNDYVAVGTDGGTTGSVALIGVDTNNMALIGIDNLAKASKNVFLLNDGTLYYTYRDQNNNTNDKLKVLFDSHSRVSVDPLVTIPQTASRSANLVYGNKSSTNYGVAYGDARDVSIGFNKGPALPTTTPVINDLWVTKATSRVDGKGNTIYLADNAQGVVVIHEKLDDWTNGSVKYYTKDYITQEIPGNITGYWNFDAPTNFADDVSIAGRDLSSFDNAPTNADGGVRGLAATFDADDQQAFGNFMPAPYDGLSIGAWIYPTDVAGKRVIAGRYSDAPYKGYRLYLENGAPVFEVSPDGFFSAYASSSAQLAVNNWYHVVGVMTPRDKMRVYVNGQLVAEQAQAPSTINPGFGWSVSTGSVLEPSTNPSTFPQFFVGRDAQEHGGIPGTLCSTTQTCSTGIGYQPIGRYFNVGDFVSVYNVTAGTTTVTAISDVDTGSSTVVFNNSPGSSSDSIVVTRLNTTHPMRADSCTSAACTALNIYQLFTNFGGGDLLGVYNQTTGQVFQVALIDDDIPSTNTTLTLSAGVGAATTNQIYVTRLNDTIYSHNNGALAAGARNVFTVPNTAKYRVGDFVVVSDTASAFSSVQTVITALSATQITTLDTITVTASEDVAITRISKQQPIGGTAASATVITGPNRTQFNVGDLVELYNSTDAQKVQTSVTAVSATTITTLAGTASQTGGETLYVSKINVNGGGTEYYDGRMDDLFVSQTAIQEQQVKRMYETGWAALANHTASRVTGVTDANGYQQLGGSGSGGTTSANVATALATDQREEILYAGISDNSTGGVSAISIKSDSLVDLYDTTNNTTKKTDGGTQFAVINPVAISAKGVLPKYLSIAGSNGSASPRVWLEKGDNSFQDHVNNNYNPHGTTLTQTNLRVEDTLYLGKSDGQQNFFETSGNLTKFYGNLEIKGDTTVQGQLLSGERQFTAKDIFAGFLNDDGRQQSMVLGPDDLPRLVFYGETLTSPTTLKFLRCLNLECTNYTYRLLDDGGENARNTGSWPSIELGPDNLPRIVYVDNTYTRLFFIRCLDEDCRQISKVILPRESTMIYPEVAVRSDGTAVISAATGTGVDGPLEIISCRDIDCTSWSSHRPDPNISAGQSDVEIVRSNGLDQVKIAWHNATGNDLMFSYCLDRNCSDVVTKTLSSTDVLGFYPSMVLDSAGYPYIVAQNQTGTDSITYVNCFADPFCAAPTITSLDTAGPAVKGLWLSIDLMPNSTPIISEFDDTNDDLRVVSCNNTACGSPTITTIDSAQAAGGFSNIKVKSNGLATMTYFYQSAAVATTPTCGSGNCAVKMARCLVSSCATSTNKYIYSFQDITENATTHVIRQVIGFDNLSRIAFVATDDHIYYIRCLDSDCDSLKLLQIEDTAVAQERIGMTLGPDGFLRVVYENSSNNIVYIRCTDDDCTAPVKTTVVSSLEEPGAAGVTMTTFFGPDIAIGRDGLARISFQANSGSNLTPGIARCLNQDCTESNARAFRSVFSSRGNFAFTSIILDQYDFPAVLYARSHTDAAPNNTQELRYDKCRDVDCNTNYASSVITQTTTSNTWHFRGEFGDINPATGTPTITVNANSDRSGFFLTCDGWDICNVQDGSFVRITGSSGSSGVTMGGARLDKNTGQLIIGSGQVNNIGLTRCSDYLCTAQSNTSAYLISRTTLSIPYAGIMQLRYYGTRTEATFAAIINENSLYYFVASGVNNNIGSPDRPFSNVYANKLQTRNTTIDALDLAEEYPTSEFDISAGDVVSFDPTRSEHIHRSRVENDPKLAGVVSTRPGVLLQDQTVQGDKVPLALSGRVPVKIDPDSEPIKVGDWLTSSDKPGLAKKASQPGYMVGRALKDWQCSDPEEVEGEGGEGGEPPPEETEATTSGSLTETPAGCDNQTTIVFVQLGYFNPDILLDDSGEVTITKELSDLEASQSGQLELAAGEYVVRDATGRIIKQIGRFSRLFVGQITAGLIQTQELIVGQQLQVPAIRTDLLSPTASGSGNIVIDLRRPAASGSGELDQLGTLFVDGNASVSGTLFAGDLNAYSARMIQLESAAADVLVLRAGDASISGTLRANRLEGEINSEQILGLEERVRNLITLQRAENVSASEEGLLAGTQDVQRVLSLLNGSPLATSEDPWGTVGIPESAITLADLAQIDLDVQINGLLAVQNLVVQDTLALGTTLFRQHELAWDPGETFTIQPSGQGTLSLLASTMVLSSDGVQINTDLSVGGDVRVGQNLLADRIQPNQNQNVEVQLASADRLGELVVRGANNQEVAAFSASGSARLRKLIIAAENAGADGETTTSIITNATAGTATLPASASAFTVRNTQIFDSSLIYITPASSTQNHVLFIQSKGAENTGTPETEGFFVVAIDSPIDQPILFNWWIIN